MERSSRVSFQSAFPEAILNWDLTPLPSYHVECAFESFCESETLLDFPKFKRLCEFIRIVDGIECEWHDDLLQDIFIDLFRYSAVDLKLFSANFNRFWCARHELYRIQLTGGSRLTDMPSVTSVHAPANPPTCDLKTLREEFIKVDTLRMGRFRLAGKDDFITWSNYKHIKRNNDAS